MNALPNHRRRRIAAPPLCVAVWLLLPLFVSCGAANTVTSQNNFRFEYVFQAGYGVAPIKLEINGLSATLVRRAADVAGESIGVFGAQLDDQDLARLERAFPAGTNFAARPPARDAGAHLIKMKTAARQIEIHVANDPAALGQLSRLIGEIERLKARLLKSPARTLSLALLGPPTKTNDGRRLTVTVRLSNAGVNPITLNADATKLWVESTTPRPAADSQVTPLPAVWRRVGELARLNENLRIDGGMSREVEVAVPLPEAPSLLRARFESEGEMKADDVNLSGSALSDAIEVGAAPRR